MDEIEYNLEFIGYDQYETKQLWVLNLQTGETTYAIETFDYEIPEINELRLTKKVNVVLEKDYYENLITFYIDDNERRMNFIKDLQAHTGDREYIMTFINYMLSE